MACSAGASKWTDAKRGRMVESRSTTRHGTFLALPLVHNLIVSPAVRSTRHAESGRNAGEAVGLIGRRCQ